MPASRAASSLPPTASTWPPEASEVEEDRAERIEDGGDDHGQWHRSEMDRAELWESLWKSTITGALSDSVSGRAPRSEQHRERNDEWLQRESRDERPVDQSDDQPIETAPPARDRARSRSVGPRSPRPTPRPTPPRDRCHPR